MSDLMRPRVRTNYEEAMERFLAYQEARQELLSSARNPRRY